ncbi:hypothetical protein BELL_0349g00100 [Botrytis elliptica]|uniref:Uncharacterized protein n=1 Tax=Botrytis elliptica TaxID=278938 RepID=A0A4Z1JJT7_9HELO|nr:hypothetical protein BELL_0349g00100 [Botrytis elliptica]
MTTGMQSTEREGQRPSTRGPWHSNLISLNMIRTDIVSVAYLEHEGEKLDQGAFFMKSESNSLGIPRPIAQQTFTTIYTN